jgi:hypothetical protein
MNSTANGVAISGPELRALLKFASKEEADRDKYGVQVVIKGEKVWARATNGQVSLELNGISDTRHADGEWFVHRDFLVRGGKLITGEKAVLRLEFSGSSLNRALVEQNDVEIASMEVPADAAVAQVSFPAVDKQVKLPARSRTVAHCSALAGAHAALLELVQDACGVEHCDLYPPKDPDAHWVFVCADQGATTAQGTLRPMISMAATAGDGHEEDDAPKGKRGRKNSDAQQEIAH